MPSTGRPRRSASRKTSRVDAGQRDDGAVVIAELELSVPREADVELERRIGERLREEPEAFVRIVLDDQNAHVRIPFQQRARAHANSGYDP
jgi:hypothetical protein